LQGSSSGQTKHFAAGNAAVGVSVRGGRRQLRGGEQTVVFTAAINVAQGQNGGGSLLFAGAAHFSRDQSSSPPRSFSAFGCALRKAWAAGRSRGGMMVFTRGAGVCGTRRARGLGTAFTEFSPGRPRFGGKVEASDLSALRPSQGQGGTGKGGPNKAAPAELVLAERDEFSALRGACSGGCDA